MSGFFGSGSNAEQDLSRAKTGFANEQNIFNYALPEAKSMAETAKTTTTSGLGAMDTVKQYFQNIMSGNRPALMASVAPEVNAINAQAAGARTRQAALGTARGGGTAAINEGAETSRMSAIDTALMGARPAAAAKVAEIGGAEANVGLQQQANALRELGLGEEAVQNIISGSLTSEQIQDKIHTATMAKIGAMIGTVLGLPMLGGGAGTTIGGSLAGAITGT